MKKPRSCEGCKFYDQVYVPSHIVEGSELLLLGDSPWKQEVQEETVFCGPSGDELDGMLESTEIDRSKTSIINVVKCQAFEDKKTHGPAPIPKAVTEQCVKTQLIPEILKLKPKVIVPMGDTALHALTKKRGITKQRGFVFDHEITDGINSHTAKVIPTFHPAYILRSRHMMPFVLSDLSQARDIIGEVKAKKLKHTILDTKKKTIKFLKKLLKKKKPFAFDLETTGLNYISDEILCASISDRDFHGSVLNFYARFPKKNKWAWDKKVLRLLYKLIHSGILIYGQNLKFDLHFLHYLFLRELGIGIDIWKVNWYELLNMQNLKDENVPKSLKQLIFLYTPIRYTKKEIETVRGGTLVLATVKARSRYCAKDTAATFMIGKKLVDWLKNHEGGVLWDLFEKEEMPFSKSLFEMENFGMHVDTDRINVLRKSIGKKLKQFRQRMWDAAGVKFNVRSTKELPEILFTKLKLKGSSDFKTKKTKKYSTSKAHIAWLIEKYPKNKFLKALQGYRQYDKIKSTFCDGLRNNKDENNIIHTDFLTWGTVSGRPSSINPNLLNIPRDKEFVDKDIISIRKLFTARPGYKMLVADYCVTPDTKILGTDLIWRRADEIKKGDELIGFDENLEKKHKNKYKGSKVKHVKRLKRECYEIITDKGKVIASDEHAWVTKPQYPNGEFRPRQWVKSKDLKCGDTISFFAKPWEVDTSQEAGYLAGFFDGEGYVSKYGAIGFGQNPGIVTKYVEKLLKEKGFPWFKGKTSTPTTTCRQYRVCNKENQLQFLGSIRPKRLLEKSRVIWENRRTWGTATQPAKVLKVRKIGVRDVIAIETTTKTFIANGFLSHNSQIELKAIALLANVTKLLEGLANGEDFHMLTARDMFGEEFKEAESIAKTGKYNGKKYSKEKQDIFAQRLDTMRSESKTFNFAMVFQAGVKKLASGLKTTESKAREFMEQFFETFPEIQQLLRLVENEVEENGRVQLPNGRYRRFSKTSERYEKFKQYRQAFNFLPQGTAGYVGRGAVIKILKLFKKHKIDGMIINTVYDSIMAEVKEKDVNKALKIMIKVLTRKIKWLNDFIFTAKIGIGDDWHEAEDKSNSYVIKSIKDFREWKPKLKEAA